MKNYSQILIFCSVVFFFLFCKDETNIQEEEQILKEPTLEDIDFNFKLLDTLRREKTEFKYGENIIFSFQIKNESKKNLEFLNFFNNYNFLKVEKIQSDGNNIIYGQPYNVILKLMYFTIKASSTYFIEQSWYGNVANMCTIYNPIGAATEKKSLPPGEYICSFSQSIHFYFKTNLNKRDSIIFENKQFEIKFTIKD